MRGYSLRESHGDSEMSNEQTPVEDEAPPGFWRLFRDVIAFQFKLLADGARDLLLSPLSIGAALLGIVTHRRDPAFYFRRLMAFGLRTDRWINLFGAHDHEETGEPSSDQVIRHFEDLMISEYRKRAGGSAVTNNKPDNEDT